MLTITITSIIMNGSEIILNQEDVKNEEQSLLSNSSQISYKSDCSTQVNMDDNAIEAQNAKDSRKAKKKQYKRKRKEKQRQLQKLARAQLLEAMDRMYYENAKFDEMKEEILINLSWLLNGEKFHIFLNEAIQFHVNDVQKDIWEYMQEIIHEKQFENPQQNEEFYLLMIEKIYQQYLNLQRPSLEIEKIINLFMSLKNNLAEEKNKFHNLANSTFHYLLESDEKIKSLIRICNRRISSKSQDQAMKLKRILKMMIVDDNFDESSNQSNQQESVAVVEEVVVAEDAEDAVNDENQNQNQKKKKRKKKAQETETITNAQIIVQRISNTVIVKDNRAYCEAGDEWACSLVQKFTRSA